MKENKQQGELSASIALSFIRTVNADAYGSQTQNARIATEELQLNDGHGIVCQQQTILCGMLPNTAIVQAINLEGTVTSDRIPGKVGATTLEGVERLAGGRIERHHGDTVQQSGRPPNFVVFIPHCPAFTDRTCRVALHDQGSIAGARIDLQKLLGLRGEGIDTILMHCESLQKAANLRAFTAFQGGVIAVHRDRLHLAAVA
mmetsp:Transcript_12552/g.31886  ORF Transcript_12552/g.31886 Transcript_12552/m.31886 type:complete len:202 (-) Transcript_12552:790-1395(-)